MIVAQHLEKIADACEFGHHFLYERQLPSGEFTSYRSRHPEMLDDCVFDSSPFPTALISYSLSFFSSEKAKEMLQKSCRFLLNEMESCGTWRYWTAQHEHHKHIPPDIDDIVCASMVLQQNGFSFPDNKELVLANRNRQQLLLTWIVPRFQFPLCLNYWRVVLPQCLNPVVLYIFWKMNESEPDDIDGVVNANALCYLGESEATQKIIQYLCSVINDGKEDSCDKWHLSRFNFYYSLSRCAYKKINGFENIRDLVLQRIAERVNDNGTIGSHILDTALAICTMLNFGHSSPVLERAVEAVLKEQGNDGAWPRMPLYYGGPKKYFGWGSEELTTGFCLEALMRYAGPPLCQHEVRRIWLRV